MKAAANTVKGGNAGSISKAAHGETHSSAGYAWKLEFEHQKHGTVVPVAVEMVSLKSGEVLDSFPSIKKAAEMTEKASHNGIRSVLKGKGKSLGGSFWREAGSDTLPPPSKPRHVTLKTPSSCYLPLSSNPDFHFPDETLCWVHRGSSQTA